MSRGRLRTTSLMVPLALLATSGAAQVLPPSSDPGRLEQRFETPAVPQSLPPVELPALDGAPPPEQAGAVRFHLARVVFEGGTVYSPAALQALAGTLTGHEVSLLDLYALRDRITATYRADGYLLSQAVIPAQRIAGGVMRIVIVEGHINTVTFQGEVTDRRGLLDDYATRIKASRPLRAAVLERYVMLMNDLAGVTARTVLTPSPGDTVGSDLVIVLDTKPVGLSLSMDNRGTHPVGPVQIDAGIELNDRLGLFEQTSLRGIVTPQISELRYLDLTHTQPIGLDGTSWTAEVRRSWSKPGATVRPLAIQSWGTTLRTGFSHPLIRSRAETLRLTGDFTYRDSRTNSLGSELTSDRLRVLSVGAAYDMSDAWQGSDLLEVGAHRGLNILNATNPRRTDPEHSSVRPDFSKFTASAQRVQPLPRGFSLTLAAEAQVSPDSLSVSEKFGVGGKLFGRAFDSSEITGDNGASVRAEVSYALPIDIPHVAYTSVFGFSDYGRVWNHASATGGDRQSLASVGGGLRIALGAGVSGSLEIGKPVLRDTPVTGDRDVRGFFTLSARY
jgi:hemolysin activation/secretion protein